MENLGSRRIIITEGNFDMEFLKKVMPDDIIQTSKFIVGNGYSSLISKAKSIAIQSIVDIFLIMDSDTTDKFEINEKRANIESIFSILGKEKQINIFFFVPQLEVVFLQNEHFIEKYFQNINLNNIYSIDDFIKVNFGNRDNLLNKIDSKDLESFQNDKSIKKLIALLAK